MILRTSLFIWSSITVHAKSERPIKRKQRYISLEQETQMLDSFGLSGEANECGGLYKWKRPDINMCYPPLRWQTYDVEFKASENGNPSVMTVKHNGVVIHDNIQLRKRNSQEISIFRITVIQYAIEISG